MKKLIATVLAILCVLSFVGCHSQTPKRTKSIETDRKAYYELSYGTWECDGHIYQYRLEITGRMHDAAADTTFVYLSNIDDISFEQAWKASGLSSNSDDYFSVDDAVLVDIILH